MKRPSFITPDAPLAGMTTLGLGGNAEYLASVSNLRTLDEALGFADHLGLRMTILGGGSNVIVPDDGVSGLVIKLTSHELREVCAGTVAKVEVDGGMVWDAFVDYAVERNWAGVECLTGIPGLVGATPIQNVGAYGQEVADVVDAVHAYDLKERRAVTFSQRECGFGYRDSFFKRSSKGRYLVTSVSFALEIGGAPAMRYKELIDVGSGANGLCEVKETVRALRAKKSMLAGQNGPNRHSAGSFFVNPVVSSAEYHDVLGRALSMGVSASEVPAWPNADGHKLAAAWLIEQAGFPKGTSRGRVGQSTDHALALINQGGAATGELMAFAEEITQAVQRVWGITLIREPQLLGAASVSSGGGGTVRRS